MKTLYYIMAILTLTLGSCSSSRYMASEYDDLYFVASDQPVTTTRISNNRIPEGTLRAEEYYDNIYATDTLVSGEYADAAVYDDGIPDNYDARGGNYDYYDRYYSSRINRFYGNYFNPYWRDPFYYGYGYSPFGYSYGYRGFPYSYGYNDPFFDDSYYYGYGGMYGGYYGGFYSPYNSFYSPYYSSFYSPYYRGYYPSYRFTDERYSVPYGRTERASNLSTRWTGGTASPSSSARRDPYLSTESGRPASVQTVTSDSRRTVTDKAVTQDPVKSGTESISVIPDRRSTVTKPEYNSVDRTYTPSYNNPRMSTRPSYNNSRIDQNTSPAINNSRSNTNVNPGRTNINQSPGVRTTNPSISTGPGRSGTSAPTYSVPARRSTDIGSSSRSFNSSGSGFSSGSVSGSSRSSSVSSSGGGTSSSSSSSSSGSSSSSRGRR